MWNVLYHVTIASNVKTFIFKSISQLKNDSIVSFAEKAASMPRILMYSRRRDFHSHCVHAICVVLQKQHLARKAKAFPNLEIVSYEFRNSFMSKLPKCPLLPAGASNCSAIEP